MQLNKFRGKLTFWSQLVPDSCRATESCPSPFWTLPRCTLCWHTPAHNVIFYVKPLKAIAKNKILNNDDLLDCHLHVVHPLRHLGVPGNMGMLLSCSFWWHRFFNSCFIHFLVVQYCLFNSCFNNLSGSTDSLTPFPSCLDLRALNLLLMLLISEYLIVFQNLFIFTFVSFYIIMYVHHSAHCKSFSRIIVLKVSKFSNNFIIMTASI